MVGQFQAEPNPARTSRIRRPMSEFRIRLASGPTTIDHNEIVGSMGNISFSTFGDDPVVLARGNETEEFHFPRPEHIQQDMIQAVVDQLTGRGESPSTGRSAARTSRVIDALLEDWRLEQQINFD